MTLSLTDEHSIEFVHPARLIEHNEFGIYDGAQRPLGTVTSVGTTRLQRLRGTRREIRDVTGAAVLTLTTKVVGPSTPGSARPSRGRARW
jgi:hypothetical protein